MKRKILTTLAVIVGLTYAFVPWITRTVNQWLIKQASLQGGP